jgi:peptidyl-prolyl cis-trans isomerase C
MKRSICVALLCLGAASPDVEAQAVKPEHNVTSPAATAAREGQPPANAPIATAADWVITLADMESRMNQAMPQLRSRFATADGRRLLLNNMIDSRLLYMEAVHRGLDKDPVLRDRLQSFAEQLLSSELSKRLLQDILVGEQEAKAYYDAHPEEFTTPEQVRARHILLKTEAEADEILKLLKQGSKFEDLARSRSTDTRTAPTGGELGWFRRGVMAPEFEKAAFRLEIGALSGAVAGSFGFHIIQVEEKRAEQINPFDLEKIRIMNQLKGSKQREIYEAFKKKLRADAGIVIREDLLQPEGQITPETTSRAPQPAPIRP